MARRRTATDRERDFQAIDLHRRGMSYRQIAGQLGYKSHVSVGQAITRALEETARSATEETRQIEVDKLDDLTRVQWRILSQDHILVSNGRVMLHPDTGQPIRDLGPHVAASTILLRIAERRSKLLGLDRPVRHEVRTIDDIDARLLELAQEME